MKYLILSLFILISCVQKDNSPEGVLKEFVNSRIGNVIQKEDIMDKVTGKMKESMDSMSDEDFADFADLRNVKQNSFKIISSNCQEDKCIITYSIAYSTMENDKAAFKTEVRKIAEVVLEEGNWLISDVSNVKTYHEAQEPINP